MEEYNDVISWLHPNRFSRGGINAENCIYQMYRLNLHKPFLTDAESLKAKDCMHGQIDIEELYALSAFSLLLCPFFGTISLGAKSEKALHCAKNREAFMKRTFLAALLVIMILTLAGCGDDDYSESPAPPPIVTDILSDPVYDGDIVKGPGGVITVAQGNTQSVFAGIDPATGEEYRAFLDFPLTNVPLNAVIVSAILDIVIDSILPQPLNFTIPIRIDLVYFQPPTLLGANFDQPALAGTMITPPISQSDFGMHVPVDVTSLMVEAQRLQLPDFQIRIMEDLGAVSPGLIEINDTTGVDRGALAPLLQVTYF